MEDNELDVQELRDRIVESVDRSKPSPLVVAGMPPLPTSGWTGDIPPQLVDSVYSDIVDKALTKAKENLSSVHVATEIHFVATGGGGGGGSHQHGAWQFKELPVEPPVWTALQGKAYSPLIIDDVDEFPEESIEKSKSYFKEALAKVKLTHDPDNWVTAFKSPVPVGKR